MNKTEQDYLDGLKRELADARKPEAKEAIQAEIDRVTGAEPVKAPPIKSAGAPSAGGPRRQNR